MNEKMQKLSAFLAGAALLLAIVLLAALALSAHVVTVHESHENYPMNELVVFWQDNPLLSVLATIAAIAVMMGLHALLEKGRKLHLDKALLALWMMATAAWLWGVQLVPRADSQRVVEAALLLAQGDYAPMRDIYFNDSSYQMGICFALEMIRRLLPMLDLALVVQLLNVLMCAGMAAVMAAFIREICGDGHEKSAFALYLLFLPMPFYCTYVYGTIPMMLFTACSALCFAQYVRRGGVKYGLGFALFMGLAVVMKPNAMIAMLALAICAVLHAMKCRDIRVIAYAALMAVLCVLLPRAVVWQYELRSGAHFSGDISMLARLVMGFQRSATGAGWFNNYIDQYSTWLMEPAAAKQLILTDLRAIFAEFAAAPATFVRFVAEKCASLWLEPTYSVLWHGVVCDTVGRFNGLANMVYLETGVLRMPLERVMDALQQALYVLSLIGTAGCLKKKNDPVQILLPVIVLGGFLYHLLFEAKSQYIFVYAFFLVPLAAQGLCMLEGLLRRKWKIWKEKRASR